MADLKRGLFCKMVLSLPPISANPLVVEASRVVWKGNVLDVGCGSGENSVALALQGFSVTAIDNSPIFTHSAEQMARTYKARVRVMNQDAREVHLLHNYDLIICTGVLHFLSAPDRKKIIDKMKSHTVEGGVNVLSAFTCSSGKRVSGVLGENELRDMYYGWEILKYSDSGGEVEMIVRKNIQ